MIFTQEYQFYLPQIDEHLDQDEEFIILEDGDRVEKILFHEYHKIYEVPGLYEKLFYRRLRCQSPTVIANMLAENMARSGQGMSRLRVLDLGAGNGMVGEELKNRNAEMLVGVDVIPEAKMAALRDRSDVYEDYHVLDFTDLDPKDELEMRSCRFNCLVTVAALGFGDIPPEAFLTAFNIVENGSWIAFNIRDKFLTKDDESGFRDVLQNLTEHHFDLKDSKKYVHRYNLHDEPLTYKAFVGVKLNNVEE
ncbi:MAG: hypothetical protein R2791_16675 [Saprospiraceae bacterium]